MAKIEYTTIASADIESISVYIFYKNQSAAYKVVDDIYEKCLSVSNMPESGSKCDQFSVGLRFVVSKPYVIYYRPIIDGIRIIRILHGARDHAGLFNTDAD